MKEGEYVSLVNVDSSGNLNLDTSKSFVDITGTLHLADNIQTITPELIDSIVPDRSVVKDIIFPESVQSIDAHAFMNFTSLETLNVPSHVTDIGEGAFRNCTSLNSVAISAQIDTVKADTFKNCNNLSHVLMNENIKEVHESAFANTKSEKYNPQFHETSETAQKTNFADSNVVNAESKPHHTPTHNVEAATSSTSFSDSSLHYTRSPSNANAYSHSVTDSGNVTSATSLSAKSEAKIDKLANNIENWKVKTEEYKAKLSKVEMKSQAFHDKQDKPMNTHTIVLYSEADKATGENRLHLRVDSTPTTKSQYEKNKPRGLLHKLDAAVKTENVGFIVPVIKNNPGGINNGAISVPSREFSFQSKALPSVIQDALPYTKKTLLAAENAVLKTGDAFKHVAQPFARMSFSVMKTQLSNQVYRAAQENVGLKATVGTVNAAVSIGRMTHRWSSSRQKFKTDMKGYKLEQKQAHMKAKIEKYEMKSAVAKQKGIYEASAANAKSLVASGLMDKKDLKFSRSERKKAWKKVFDGTQQGNYLEKPKMKAFQKASRADVLAAREYKAASQLYRTKIVAVKEFNTATGKTRTRFKTVVDKSSKKIKKPKRPESFVSSAANLGASAIGNKITSALASSDDVGAQALGKGLQFGRSINNFQAQQKALRSKLKMDKKIEKAQIKMEKAHNQLQLEQSKKPKPKKKLKDKKAMQKNAAKKRNAKQFQENIKKQAKKLKDKAVAKVKELVKKKLLPALLGVGGAAVIMLLVIMIPLMLLGGSSSTGAVGLTVYTNDLEGLIEFNNDVNDTFWKWQSSINESMIAKKKNDTDEWLLVTEACDGGVLSDCPSIESAEYVEKESNVYSIVKNLYGGEKCGFSNYDILCLYAYFTVKFQDKDWKAFSSEMSDYFKDHFVLDCRQANGDVIVDEKKEIILDNHISIQCTVNSDKSHTHTAESDPHIVDTSDYQCYYYLYPKNTDKPMTIQRYIADEVKKIGEVGEDGKSAGERHYEALMISLGFHQAIDFPAYIGDTDDILDWSKCGSKFGTYGILVDKNENSQTEGVKSDYQYEQKTENDVKAYSSCSSLRIVAGGEGIVKAKTSNSITIEYPDTYPDKVLTVTYKSMMYDDLAGYADNSAVSTTSKNIGDTVEKGEVLFYSPQTTLLGKTYLPAFSISAVYAETNEYINPILVVKSKQY